MKITAFYYLAYPDCSPADPMVAASEVYVEVAVRDGTIDAFDYTYAVTICTLGFLQRHLGTHSHFAGRSMIVVNRFDDDNIRRVLEAILPNIDEVAIKK
jgi:hypothetical protein